MLKIETPTSRKKLGSKLHGLRGSRSINSFMKVGLTHMEIKSMENGLTNYTIDKLIAYINELLK